MGQMAKKQTEIEEADEAGKAMEECWLRRTYIHDKHEEKRIGTMGYGHGFGRSYFSGKVGPRARARYTPETTRELARYSEGQAGRDTSARYSAGRISPQGGHDT